MSQWPQRAIVGLVGLGAIAIGLPPQHSQAQFPPVGTFTATEACAATPAIQGSNPGNVRLTVGQTYEAVGFNRPDGPYVLLAISQARPVRRWVSVTCGTFEPDEVGVDAPSVTPSPQPNRPTRLLPFFDNENNPVPMDFPRGTQKDISPPPPALTVFDRRVLALCGPGFDAPVSRQSFQQLLRDYPDVVQRLQRVTGGALRPGRRTEQEFVADLTEAWFRRGGFKHIFCGDTDGRKLGGLHFHGRYLALQEAGIGGRITRTRNGQDAVEEVVDGVIYTFGAQVVRGDRVIAEAPIKGYPYVSNALEMLVDVTRAYHQFAARATERNPACLYTVRDPDAAPFQAVFVMKQNAIVTFYPDATPDRNLRACDE